MLPETTDNFFSRGRKTIKINAGYPSKFVNENSKKGNFSSQSKISLRKNRINFNPYMHNVKSKTPYASLPNLIN